MDLNFRRSLEVSLLVHLTLLLFTSLAIITRRKYITIPVDLIYYPPPAAKEITEPPKEEEITIPKKPKPPKKEKKTKETKREEPKPAQQSRPQALQPTSALTTDTAKFPYLYYLKNIRERISGAWQYGEPEEGFLKTVVYFKIKRDGSITEPAFKERSGDTVFDSLAMRAVKVSAPFPPLPAGYDKDTLGVYFEFAYRE